MSRARNECTYVCVCVCADAGKRISKEYHNLMRLHIRTAASRRIDTIEGFVRYMLQVHNLIISTGLSRRESTNG